MKSNRPGEFRPTGLNPRGAQFAAGTGRLAAAARLTAV
jgi:hypothetical protein